VKHKLHSKLQLFIFLLLGISAGCVKKTTVVPQSERLLPAKSATRAELFQSLEESSKLIETLKGTFTVEFSRGGAKSGVLDEYRETKGYVFVERPDHIRVQVQMPIVLTTVAVMVSDGHEYRLSIPVKNQFAVADVNAPINPSSAFSNLRPRIFLDGLFVDIRPYLNKPTSKTPLFEEAVVGVHSYYVFSFFDAAETDPQLLEKIWIDRSNMEVSRKQLFGKDGRLEQDVDYQEYKREGQILFPKTIVIRRPVEDFTVKMTFQKAEMNERLDEKVFDLPRPSGAELVQITK
jgi:outer membrane lipoprotein-sorting protein